MTEDFDKEAEREKLKEKYERDKQKRQATEQMSELLLQGATMTNAHCSECGDPIFRYEEQEFCPTCEKPVDRGGNEEEAEGGDDDNESIQVTTPSDEARVTFGEDGQATEPAQDGKQPMAEPASEQSAASHSAETENHQSAPEDPRRISNEQPRRQQSEPQRQSTAAVSQQPQPSKQTQQPSGAVSGEASVAAARESLVKTLTQFSQQAAATDDPNRAQEHLAAAREAAEALAALRQ